MLIANVHKRLFSFRYCMTEMMETVIKTINSLEEIDRVEMMLRRQKLELYKLAEFDDTSDYVAKLEHLNKLINTDGVSRTDVLERIGAWFDGVGYELIVKSLEARQGTESRMLFRKGILEWLNANSVSI
jgi:hypothetical protein